MSDPNERVTMRTLDSKLEVVRAEVKTQFAQSNEKQSKEHNRTRLAIVILAAPSVAKAIPLVLGYFGWKVGW